MPVRRRWLGCFTGLSLLASASTFAEPPVTVPPSPSTPLISAEPAAQPDQNLRLSTHEQLLAVRRVLDAFTTSANPRHLGDAQRRLLSIPATQRTATFFLYRASLRQSLHQFKQARADLDAALALAPDTRQAHLMGFNIAIVQGQMAVAQRACAQLTQADLFRAACHAQLQALNGNPEAAFVALKAALSQQLLTASAQAKLWAVTTLADIAERRADYSEAETLWQLALSLKQGDLYARARLCELHVMQQQWQAAIRLTDNHLDIDNLAVCRARALQATGDGADLIAQLAQRFAEARWRGEILHKRAFAEYLLLMGNEPDEALAMARENWQHQRELPDERLLQRARLAAGQESG